MRSVFRTTTTTLVAALALGGVGVVSPARADVVDLPDASRDMVELHQRGGPTPAPRRRVMDIGAVRVEHRADRLNLSMSFTEVTTPERDEARRYMFRVRAGGEVYRVGLVEGFRTSKPRQLVGDEQLRCPRATRELDRSDAIFRMSIPRRCLGDPETVRVSADSYDRSGSRQYVDQGLRTGGTAPAFTAPVAVGS